MKIDPDFAGSVRSIFVSKHKEIASKINRSGSPSRHTKMQMLAARIQDADREVARSIANLERLPFRAFGIRHNAQQAPFLVGLTKNVYVEYDTNFIVPRYADMGSYVIAIPINDLMICALDNIHFVPAKRLRQEQRHFHHIAVRQNSPNPLDYACQTCWGSVHALILNAMDLVDIAAVFESCYVFLHLVDYEDKLANPHWIRKIGIAEYCEKTGQPIQDVLCRRKHTNFGEEDLS